MQELSLIEVLKYTANALLGSKVFILLLLELAILIIGFVFAKLMNKKVVKISCIVESLIVFGLYISNYVETIVTFINNVSTKLVELIYFPTTLEFIIVMVLSFIIMVVTLLNKKTNVIIKVINTILPIVISFLFLSIIEYINVNNVPFDEFSVFTNPILMSLFELAMGLFISWLIGLVVYKIDVFIISSISQEDSSMIEDVDLVTVNLPEDTEDEEIELPRLKKNGVIR